MSGMGNHSADLKTPLWINAIAACAAAEVTATWIGLGSLAGFPVVHAGALRLSMDWTLAVGMEVYAWNAIRTWLGGAPGPRSRCFAMWSAFAALGLSAVGQVGYHLMLADGDRRAPGWLVGFVAVLPVAVLTLGAILAHLMRAEKDAAREAARAAEDAARQAAAGRAEAAELTRVRAELQAAREALAGAEGAARAAVEAAETARTDAEERAARAEEKAARLARKLDPPAGPRHARTAAPAGAPAGRTQLEIARAARDKAEGILAEEPGISGAELAERCGMKERWGQTVKKQFGDRVLGEAAV